MELTTFIFNTVCLPFTFFSIFTYTFLTYIYTWIIHIVGLNEFELGLHSHPQSPKCQVFVEENPSPTAGLEPRPPGFKQEPCCWTTWNNWEGASAEQPERSLCRFLHEPPHHWQLPPGSTWKNDISCNWWRDGPDPDHSAHHVCTFCKVLRVIRVHFCRFLPQSDLL